MSRRGFTLIEVVLALALLAVLMSLLQGTYSGAVKSRDRSSAQSRGVHAAAVVLDRLATELGGTRADANRPDSTGLRVSTETDGRAKLTFTAPLTPIPGVRPGGLIEVGYFVEEDGDGRVNLLRRETPDLDGDFDEGGLPYTVIHDLLRFDVLCEDGDGQWLDDWDSRDRQVKPSLPLRVSVEVAWGPDEDHERTIRTATPLYLSEGRP